MNNINIGIKNPPPHKVPNIKIIISNPVREPDEISRWRDTAKSDFMQAEWLYKLCVIHRYYLPSVLHYCVPLYNWVYVIAFDSIEKALKAVMIAWKIIDSSSIPTHHNIFTYIKLLVSHNNDQSVKFKQFENEVENLQCTYNNYGARWPNFHANCYHHEDTCIPRDHFSQSDAYNILCLAQNIIDTMAEILD